MEHEIVAAPAAASQDKVRFASVLSDTGSWTVSSSVHFRGSGWFHSKPAAGRWRCTFAQQGKKNKFTI